MKSAVKLWVACLQEAGALCRVRIARDEAYALSRVEQEGFGFLAIALSAYEKDLLTAVSRGWIGSDLFTGYRRRGGLPAFLSGFLLRLFTSDGVLKSDADPQVLKTLRQVLLLVSKIELPCAEKRTKATLSGYVETDALLEELPYDDPHRVAFRNQARVLLNPYLREVESRIWSGDWIPRHSSGAVAGRESYNSRFGFGIWTDRLQEVLPWWEDMGMPIRQYMSDPDAVTVLARSEELPVRVSTVPKTLKGPRVIAMEPVWMQYIQQGVLAVMVEVLELPRFSPLRRVAGWLDQSPNRELAREGSIAGGFATLDLSEASDRVGLWLAEDLLASVPFLRKVMLACRSERALMPGGEVIPLRKFASMGSALCFPVESLVFLTLVAMSVAEHEGKRHIADWSYLDGKTRVYGDDLIVPTPVAHSLRGNLETYGLKVNARKSFTTGLFRESCGADWFKGSDVGVFKLRSEFPTGSRQLAALDRAISFHNRAYSAGWFGTASVAKDLLKEFRVPYALVGAVGGVLWTYDPSKVQMRLHPRLHRAEYKGIVFKKTMPADSVSEYTALRKYFSPHGLPREKRHLERDGRSRYVGMNTGWIAAYAE